MLIFVWYRFEPLYDVASTSPEICFGCLDPPATQDLQQTYAKVQLLVHAKHETYNHITQQKHPFKCHTSANSTIT